MAHRIFVSYRRDDAAHVTGRIHDFLASRFGAANVFMDVDSVAPGEDFVRKIGDTIAMCDLFLLVMGPGWLNARTADGRRRIDLPGDFVRIELREALARGVKIIPVLVDGAQMPRQEDLPEDVAQMVRHNAVFLGHATFRRDMEALAAGVAPPDLLTRMRSPQGVALLAGAVSLLALGMVLTRGTDGAGTARDIPGTVSAVSLAQGEDTSGQRRSIASNGFRAERGSDGRLKIAADIPYRDRLYEASELSGLEFMSSAFHGASVDLEVSVTNQTDAPLSVREIQFDVVSAAPDIRPVPVIRENELDYRRMVIRNEGWGPMRPVRVRIDSWGVPEKDREKAVRAWRGNVVVSDPCAEPARRLPGPGGYMDAVDDEAYRGQAVLDLEGLVPADYDGEDFVCALGELQFSVLGEVRTAAFRTRVSNHLPMAVVAAPMFMTHDLYLDPERSGYVAVVPVQFDVAAGEAVTVTITVHTDKSTAFLLEQRLRTADGRIVPGEAFDLEFFVPAVGGSYSLLNPERMADVPPDVFSSFRGAPEVSEAKYDPQGNNPVNVHAAQVLDAAVCDRFAQHVSQRVGRIIGRPEADVIIFGPGESWMCDHQPPQRR